MPICDGPLPLNSALMGVTMHQGGTDGGRRKMFWRNSGMNVCTHGDRDAGSEVGRWRKGN
jgi:hypothetical protein